MKTNSLTEMAVDVLSAKNAEDKVKLSNKYAELWLNDRKNKNKICIGNALCPDTPTRPEKPNLLPPRLMPKRKFGSEKGRIALIHSVAHIELNAIDLHWDIIARFSKVKFPLSFYDDWVNAAKDETKHFGLLSQLLQDRNSFYGALPAHDSMWDAAKQTDDDILGRLAVVPMVLEARGLDVTPKMIELFKNANEQKAVEYLNIIYSEEVNHVSYGSKWFNFLCGRNNLDPKPTFHKLVRKYFHSTLKPPFNEEKRAESGLPPDFYWPLTEQES
jgi:uncharacterized ferritin-like protein (DUF455 family)